MLCKPAKYIPPQKNDHHMLAKYILLEKNMLCMSGRVVLRISK
jgi:hypothetical protein